MSERAAERPAGPVPTISMVVLSGRDIMLRSKSTAHTSDCRTDTSNLIQGIDGFARCQEARMCYVIKFSHCTWSDYRRSSDTASGRIPQEEKVDSICCDCGRRTLARSTHLVSRLIMHHISPLVRTSLCSSTASRQPPYN